MEQTGVTRGRKTHLFPKGLLMDLDPKTTLFAKGLRKNARTA